MSFFSDAANMNVRNGGADVASWEAPAFRESTTCPATMPPGYTCMDFDPARARTRRSARPSLPA